MNRLSRLQEISFPSEDWAATRSFVKDFLSLD